MTEPQQFLIDGERSPAGVRRAAGISEINVSHCCFGDGVMKGCRRSNAVERNDPDKEKRLHYQHLHLLALRVCIPGYHMPSFEGPLLILVVVFDLAMSGSWATLNQYCKVREIARVN